MSGISDGMQYGWTAPVMPILKSPDTPVPITEDDEVWLETIFIAGGLAGLPITIYAVDNIGRKGSILFSCVFSLLAWILIAIGWKIEVLYAARFIAGIAGVVAFVSSPMYIAEIADYKIRGFLAGLIYSLLLRFTLVLLLVLQF